MTDAIYGTYSGINEEWRPIDGWPYSVSNQGRVRRDQASVTSKAGKILMPCRHTFGYHHVVLHRGDGKPEQFTIHKLVATAFHGPKPRGAECAHLDGNPTNNDVRNLAWVTSKENSEHMRRHGTRLYGEKNPATTLDTLDVCAIRAMAKAGLAQWKIARFYGIRQQAVSRIVNWKRWRHV